MKKIAEAAIFLASLSISLIVADLTLKAFRIPTNNSRIMLLGGGAFKTDSATKLRTYKPNTEYRNIAIYGDSIEYDITYKTNFIGSRETSQCGLTITNNSSQILPIAGDSFTEGYAAQIPWISFIDKFACFNGITPVNLSMGGYGIEDMLNSLVFAKNAFNSKRAIIAVIEDDFYRSFTPIAALKDCSNYYQPPKPPACGTGNPEWWHIPFDMERTRLLALAQTKYKYGINELLFLSLKKARPILRNAIKAYAKKSPNELPILNQSINSLQKAAEHYNNSSLLLVLLPTKESLNNNISGFENRKIQAAIAKLQADTGLQFADLTKCPLDIKEDFFNLETIDDHGKVA